MKKFSRKIAAAAALAITVSSCMTGCFNNTGSGSGSGSSGGNSETVLRVGYTQEPSSFDPADFTIVNLLPRFCKGRLNCCAVM